MPKAVKRFLFKCISVGKRVKLQKGRVPASFIEIILESRKQFLCGEFFVGSDIRLVKFEHTEIEGQKG